MYDIDDCITLIGAVIDRWLEDAATAARRGNPAELREAIQELGLPVPETLRRLKVPPAVLVAESRRPARLVDDGQTRCPCCGDVLPVEGVRRGPPRKFCSLRCKNRMFYGQCNG